MEKIDYYRKKPARDIDVNQTLYTTIKTLNHDDKDLEAVGFLSSKMTFGQLQKKVDKLADAYSKLGLKEGDTVAICSISMPLVQENLLACSKLGITSKWIDLRIKGADLINKINESKCQYIVAFDGILEELQNIINETDVKKIFLASPKDYLNPFIRFLADLKDKHEGKFIKYPKDKRFIKYTDFIQTGCEHSEIVPVCFEKDRPSLVIQSSGSTGKSKSIIHTEYNFNSEMQKEAYTDLPLIKGKTMHVSIPPFIIYGLCNSVYASLVFGMKAEMSPYVDENTVFNDLGKFDVSCAAPVHYRYIYSKICKLQNEISELEKDNSSSSKKELKACLKELQAIMSKISKIDLFVSGGDKIAAEELLEMEHTFGKIIVNGYGNNELVGAAIISPVYASKPNSIGIPMKDIDVAAFDVETNKRLEDGKIGEICISSDHVFKEYLGNPIETLKVKVKHDDGKEWIHTGDLGYKDEDGYIYITGRSKRLIKRAAFKIAPETIEEVIMSIDGVKDCVVVGVPDEKELEVPFAFVEISSNQDIINQIIKICHDKLPEYEIPAHFEIVDKIKYKNGKHAFKEMENDAVKCLESKGKVLKKVR